MKHLYIATPVYDQQVAVGYCQSLCLTLMACTKAGIVVSTDYKGGPYIHDNRNWLVHRFMKSGADTMLFIDADVSWDAQAVPKLYHSKHDVCGGVYPFKKDSEDYPIKLMDRIDREYRETMYLPGGFIQIRKTVFDAMTPKADNFTCPSFGGETVYEYFQNVVYPGSGKVGEDVEFCNVWRRMGGTIWCLPDIDFEHQGPKQWKGNFAAFLGDKQAEAA